MMITGTCICYWDCSWVWSFGATLTKGYLDDAVLLIWLTELLMTGWSLLGSEVWATYGVQSGMLDPSGFKHKAFLAASAAC